MTRLPSNNAKISLAGLAALGISAITIIVYNFDKWFANGVAVKRVAEACSGFGTGCSDAFTTILQVVGSPQQLLLSLAIAVLIAAFIKAALVVVSARRVAARYALSGRTFPELHNALSELGAEDIRIRVADNDGVSAFTYGVLKPTICLSKGLVNNLNDGELIALIAHEIGHARRRDNLAIFIALFIRDFLWALPVSHHLFAIFVREKEYAADDFAVSLTKNPLDLAGAIVSVAKADRRKPSSPAYATFFPGKATAKARINRLLGSGDKVRPSLSRLLASLAVSALMVITVVGFAYAQPSIKGGSLDTCRMGNACIDQDYKCCNVK
ncbi:MAG: M56 family metallopeptidase [Actinobacteria bacterium]|nr:M56 family metallopeptidase [Actinomycetota bacterium]